MAGVDDRVVSMQFDNAQFEQRLATTLKGLDDLNKHLDFTAAQRNLGDLSAAGDRFNLGHMGDAIQGVSAKFLGLATVGITALSNITNRAVDAGINLVKSFTFAPIQQGFGEFGEKIGSIQTILANTARYGTTLPDVTKNLDQLSTYADKTIFSFGDMTKNIGLFTNAGIKIEDATSSIKGFSNVAAASGTSAQGAAGAAYQLSQALSAGKVTLMDWRSLTNVGMGNKNMQDSLVQIADKMGSLKKAGIDAKTVQSDFNGSLEKGWMTADVMSTYLKIMAGDMNKAKITALGFSGAEADAFLKTQKTAEEAATVVRTFPAMMDTIRSTFVTGWSKSFEILFGGFEGSSKIFTSIANSVGGFLGGISKARNDLLSGWDKLGGRTVLIDAFKDAFKALGEVIRPIKEVFRQFFPAKTAQDLMNLTNTFADLAGWLHPLPATVDKIKRVFGGLFATFDIVRNVIKEVIFVIFGLIGEFRGAGGGAFEMAAKLGDLMVKVDDFLVKGGALHRFFLHIHAAINPISDVLKDVTGSVKAFMYTLKTGFTEDEGTPIERLALSIRHLFGVFRHEGGDANAAVGRLQSRFEGLKTIFERLSSAGERVRDALGATFKVIKDWMSELGQRIAESLKPGDFDTAVDAVNIGLLGGIVLMLRKFLKGGVKLDFGGGILDKAGGALDAFKDKMKAVQNELKAKALMEIAIALGVLTASIVVLSLIDSAKLTKAMVALGIGMAQLVGVMKLMDAMASNAKDAAKFAILAAGLTMVSTAALILSGAVAILAQLSWEELARGLSGVTALLTLMVGTEKLMEGSALTMLAMGAAMIPFATGLVILAGAVALFGQMSWADMLKGMVGLAAALTILTVAVNAMPFFTMLSAGLAMIPLATGIVILAGAIKIFATMSWEEMAKGMVGLAGALLILAVATNAMPIWLPLIGAGLILVANALILMMVPLELLAHMKLGDMIQALGGLAAMLGILAGGLYLMTGTLAGAAALVVAAGALTVLSRVLTTLGGMSVKELAIGIVGIAAAIGVIAGMAMGLSEAIPLIFLLGVALGAVGVAFALFGVGAFLVAKAFQAMAEAGKAGTRALIDSLVMVIRAIPTFVKALIASMTESATELLKSADLILRLVTALLLQILATVIKLAPQIAIAIGAILDAGMMLLIEKGPKLIETGFQLLLMLLRGFRDHVGELTTLAIDILINFAMALANGQQRLVDAGLNLLFAFLGAIAARANDIMAAGANLFLAFLAGMINNLYHIIDFAVTVLITFAQTIGNEITRIVDAGVVVVLNFIAGLVNNLYRIIDFAVTVMITFAQTIGNETERVVNAGADILIKFAANLAGNAWRVAHEGVSIVIAFLDAIGGEAIRLARGAADALILFINGLSAAIDEKAPEIRAAAVKLAESIVTGITGGLLDPKNIGNVVDGATGLVKSAFKGAKDWLLSKSPSRRFMELGKSMAQGVALALDSDTDAQNSAIAHAERIVAAFSQTLSTIPDSLEGMDDLSPVITPVLDLTNVKMGAKGIGQLMSVGAITPSVSIGQARDIATTTDLTTPSMPEPVESHTEINLTQNNYSPEALGAGGIYKQTKSLMAKTKEELDL